MGHCPGHADPDSRLGPRREQRVRRHHGIYARRTDSPGRRQPEPARRDQPPGGKHELVRLRRHHRHVHERVRQLDSAAGTCSRGDQYAAFWVGLDGYSSSSVEQTGSEVDCVGRTAEYYAWYEMYPGPSENYSNTVRAGDHFNASVTYEGSNEFSLYIDGQH